jgi:hypothetical protein
LKSEKITSLEKMTNNKTKRRQNLERVYNNILKNLESLSSKQKILEEKVSKMTKSIEDKNLENYGNFENIEMFDESLVNSLHNSTDKKTIDDEKMKILTNLLSTRIDQSNTYLDNLNSAFQSQNENKVTPHNSSNNVSSSYSYYSGDIEIVSNNSNSNSNSNANSPTNRSKLDTILSSSSLSNTKAFTLNSTNDNNYNDIFQYKTGSPYSEDYDNLSLKGGKIHIDMFDNEAHVNKYNNDHINIDPTINFVNFGNNEMFLFNNKASSSNNDWEDCYLFNDLAKNNINCVNKKNKF